MSQASADPKVLTAAEQGALHKSNDELAAAIQQYQAAHPELNTIIKEFATAAVDQQVPAADLVRWARDYFIAKSSGARN